jgi:hypothetical protein
VNLVAGHAVDQVAPWKIIPRSNEHANIPVARPITMPNNLDALSKMASMFETNADETTAIPRYMSGENATQGAAGTAAGMSMLMGAANIVIKDLISAWDEGITRPFIEALYRWNMKFHKDPKIKGDFDVRARGAASLVAKEVRARQLNDFATLTANPMDAPFIKRQKLNQQRAEALELSDVVKTDDEVKAEQESPQAQAMIKMQSDLAAAQLAEIQAKANKMLADAEVAKRKADEVVANIELVLAKRVGELVKAAYGALQAGGVATSTPLIAPAGDEILRSSGWKDATPDVPIADLNAPPVQEQEGTRHLMGKGQSFAVEPRGQQLDAGAPIDPAMAGAAEPGPATGMVGQNGGIETMEIER